LISFFVQEKTKTSLWERVRRRRRRRGEREKERKQR
jgi:hypothetical protein